VLESVVEGDVRRVRVRVRSRRGAYVGGIAISDESQLVHFAVEGVPDQHHRPDHYHVGWMGIEDHSMPPEGVVIDVTLRGSTRIRAYAFDVTSGVGGVAAQLVRARPASGAPTNFGDRTVAVTNFEL
jgi:hypothetical protein